MVATSSLDLGVDFTPVDRVLQIGSPKGVGSLLQRAGRSGHQPGVVSRVTRAPAHALELVEVAAVRDALEAGHVEERLPLDRPLDVLVQHLVTVALGGGFELDQLLAEVRRSYAYRCLAKDEWAWAVDFVTSDAAIAVKYLRGGSLGTINESFISGVKPGDKFIFAGFPSVRVYRISMASPKE